MHLIFLARVRAAAHGAYAAARNTGSSPKSARNAAGAQHLGTLRETMVKESIRGLSWNEIKGNSLGLSPLGKTAATIRKLASHPLFYPC